MPDEEIHDELPDTTPASMRQHFDRIKAQRDEARQQAAEATQVRRENTFLRAGVDLDSPLGQLFAKGYDGELDVEAVKTQWGQLAPTSTQSDEQPLPPGDEGPSAEALAQQEALAAARASLHAEGTPPGEEPTPDPRIDMVQTYRAAKTAGKTDQAAMRDGFQKLINAAVAGDERALFDRDRWLAERQ